MAAGIRGSRRHVAKQHHEDDEPDRSQAPPEESMDEVATRIRKEVGEAARRLRRDAVRFEKGPPPDQGTEDGVGHA
ncbi:hypothetical protein ABZ318_00785 [Streptomyces sp. NPDC006197]|uniref:hypothetical protein n=1 Tax=Streptomyces sp. NPDC006197 TaxID=3156685 RepID=UPI0033BEF706